MPLSRQQKIWLVIFGQNVRRVRLARKMTQERLAERADLSLRNIQRVEAGEINLLLTTVLRIQRALGCAITRLTPARQSLVRATK